MAVLVASIFGREVPPDSRLFVVIIFSLGLGLSASFLGGAATLEGRLPLPMARKSPLKFSVAGGVAVVLISSIVGYWLYMPHDFLSISDLLKIIGDSGRAETERTHAVIELRDRYQLKDWRRSVLAGMTLPAEGWQNLDFTEANLTNVTWEHADLAGSELVRANLEGADMKYVDLRKGALNGAIARKADFQSAILFGVWLRGGTYSEANFANANLKYANLQYSNFLSANFAGADLSYATFNDEFVSDITNANFSKAILMGTDFRNTRGLESATLEGAVFNNATHFPTGFDVAGRGMIKQPAP